jgi:hypothetical protein
MTATAHQTRLVPAIQHATSRPWNNWAGNVRCQPEYTFFAKSADDLSRIVKFARENGRRIRAVATGHSWSPLVPTDEVLVDITGLHRVMLDLADPAAPRVTMECGATVEEVNHALEAAGYALPSNVVLESVRFGGLIATGSHGSGWNNHTLSDLVHAIEIIDAFGELRRFEAGNDSDDVMNAARLHLGMFGLIYRITMNIQPTWNVHAKDRRVPVQAVMENLPAWVAQHDNLDLFWWPLADRFWVKTWTRTDAPATARPRYNRMDRVRSKVEMHIYQQMLELQNRVPKTTPALSPMTFAFSPSQRDQVVPIVEAIHYRRSIEVTKMGCIEIAFKVGDNFGNVRDAIQTCFDVTRQYAKRGEYPMNVTLNVRFLHNSACWLSPAYGAGHTCYIEVLSRTKDADWQRYSGELGREWLALRNAMPHWAKEYAQIPGITEHIRRQLGPSIARFNKIKSDLKMDPDGMFINKSLAEVFC